MVSPMSKYGQIDMTWIEEEAEHGLGCDNEGTTKDHGSQTNPGPERKVKMMPWRVWELGLMID